MNNTLLKLLQSVDTPTVCNAIEVAQGKRGFNSFTRGSMLSSEPDSRPIVGYAVTAKISALAEPRTKRGDPRQTYGLLSCHVRGCQR